MFSANSLEKVALRYFGMSEAQISNAERDNIGNAESFNRTLLNAFKNKGQDRKVLLNIVYFIKIEVSERIYENL